MISTVFNLLFSIFMILAIVAMFVWFFWAVGGALESDRNLLRAGLRGNEIGAIFGLIAGVATIYYFLTLM